MYKLSQECRQLANLCQGKRVTLSELSQSLGRKGGAFLSLILSIPFLFMIAVPGLSLIFGLIILVCGIRIAQKKGVWIPRFLGKKEIPAKRLQRILKRSQKALNKCERLIRPRATLVSQNPFFRLLNGLLIAFFGGFLSLPFLPGTNFTPALGVALLSIGIMEDDGLFILMGYLIFLLNLALFILLAILGIRLFF